MPREISNSDDVIDSRDVIAKIEELESDIEHQQALIAECDADPENRDRSVHVEAIEEINAELAPLLAFMGDMKGCGGDEQWRGDWYPVTIIRDSYFVDYAEELVKDIGDMPREMPGYLAIDWEATAENIRVDYSSVEFDGVTYWCR